MSASQEIRALRNAWLTEIQAIAIYETEIAFLKHTLWTKRRRTSLSLFEKILRDELDHKNEFEGFTDAPLYRWAGSLVGIFLALLPSRLSWLLHSMAEKQAEAVYLETEKKVESECLRNFLIHAACQERSHSLLFNEALAHSS